MVIVGRKGCDCGRKLDAAMAFLLAAEAGEKGLARLWGSDAKGETEVAPGGLGSRFMPRGARRAGGGGGQRRRRGVRTGSGGRGAGEVARVEKSWRPRGGGGGAEAGARSGPVSRRDNATMAAAVRWRERRARARRVRRRRRGIRSVAGRFATQTEKTAAGVQKVGGWRRSEVWAVWWWDGGFWFCERNRRGNGNRPTKVG